MTTQSSRRSTKRELLSSDYAARYFPEFIIRVAHELKVADERAREDSEGFKKACKAVRRAEKQSQKKVVVERKGHWKDIYSGTLVAADYANKGYTKQEIANATGLKVSTIRHYLQNARREGLIPKDMIVPKNRRATVHTGEDVKR